MKHIWLLLLASSLVLISPGRRPLAEDAPTNRSATADGTASGHRTAAADSNFERFGIYEATAPRPAAVEPVPTRLPLELSPGDRIALIGNTLWERSQEHGQFEAMLHQRFPRHKLVVRNLAWSADALGSQPRPDNFADTQQHLAHEKADVILAAFGFNESFAGPAGLPQFRRELAAYLKDLKSKAYNGHSAPRVVLISPIANENVQGIAAADRNNATLKQYVEAMREVAQQQQVGFADVFTDTEREMRSPGTRLTANGVHLNAEGYQFFAATLFEKLLNEPPAEVNEALRAVVVDKNRQYFRRFRPLNTFYYTGGRNKTYGYLDFLPAMRNFDLMVENRDRRIWEIAQGKEVARQLDDRNLPLLPPVDETRGANEWLSAAAEQQAFQVDPRFEVNLFAGEEQFPEIANPIQMRWDSQGRLWVSCSTTYPHVYPGHEPNDKLVILEDTDGDGRADKSTVFADKLHIPLSFEFGDGGVYVSEQPNLSFLKDTDGDLRADVHVTVLSGFGTEDSHHALHDFAWTPDGDLIFREGIFHHSQVETPYGPVRQQNSGWFRFEPRTHRLVSFGTYSSTNPWGVAFDDWGQHMASHPIYAAAFHALDPPYPLQHPTPKGLPAYSGVCGHQFVNNSTFPDELQGGFIKVRYKPTNRVEMHRWIEEKHGFREQYVGDLLFSTNLSFIPVDLQWGPRGALYVCDWYNPVKGHMQYSLRDERRDRHSGRIWRISAKDRPLHEPPPLAEASIDELLALLKRPEVHIRTWAKRELRDRDAHAVKAALDRWVEALDATDPRYRHHQLEALWTYRWIGLAPLAQAVALPGNHQHGHSHAAQHSAAQHGTQQSATQHGGGKHHAANQHAADPSASGHVAHHPGDETWTAADRRIALGLLRELLACNDHMPRMAAVQQLRYWHPYLPDAARLLNRAANDSHGLVRMEAAIAGSYIGTQSAFEAILDVLKHPREGHVAYAITSALGSHTLRPYWEGNPRYGIGRLLQQAARENVIREPRPTPEQAQFDSQDGLKRVAISCVPERMLFTTTDFWVRPGQPVKLVFTNPDATDHNLVIVRPGALAEVGIAANEMARDPRNANSDFIPPQKRELILHAARMIGPTRPTQVDVLRFQAPAEPGVYPYVCTFPGHWVVMNGAMVVAKDQASAEVLLAESRPKVVKQWTMDDFADFERLKRPHNDATLGRGMTAFVKARCNQCHVVAGHGVNLGPDLRESVKQLKGLELLRQMIEPSAKIHEKFQNYQFLLDDGRIVTGVVMKEDDAAYHVATNLLTPHSLTAVAKAHVEERVASKISPMPVGLLDVLTKDEILDLHAFVEAGGYELPEHLKHRHHHGGDHKPQHGK